MERREHRYRYIPTIWHRAVIPDLHDVWGTPYPRDPEMLRGSDPRRLSGYDVEYSVYGEMQRQEAQQGRYVRGRCVVHIEE